MNPVDKENSTLLPASSGKGAGGMPGGQEKDGGAPSPPAPPAAVGSADTAINLGSSDGAEPVVAMTFDELWRQQRGLGGDGRKDRDQKIAAVHLGSTQDTTSIGGWAESGKRKSSDTHFSQAPNIMPSATTARSRPATPPTKAMGKRPANGIPRFQSQSSRLPPASLPRNVSVAEGHLPATTQAFQSLPSPPLDDDDEFALMLTNNMPPTTQAFQSLPPPPLNGGDDDFALMLTNNMPPRPLFPSATGTPSSRRSASRNTANMSPRPSFPSTAGTASAHPRDTAGRRVGSSSTNNVPTRPLPFLSAIGTASSHPRDTGRRASSSSTNNIHPRPLSLLSAIGTASSHPRDSSNTTTVPPRASFPSTAGTASAHSQFNFAARADGSTLPRPPNPWMAPSDAGADPEEYTYTTAEVDVMEDSLRAELGLAPRTNAHHPRDKAAPEYICSREHGFQRVGDLSFPSLLPNDFPTESMDGDVLPTTESHSLVTFVFSRDGVNSENGHGLAEFEFSVRRDALWCNVFGDAHNSDGRSGVFPFPAEDTIMLNGGSKCLCFSFGVQDKMVRVRQEKIAEWTVKQILDEFELTSFRRVEVFVKIFPKN